MRVGGWLAGRQGRTVLLLSMTLGWIGFVLGATTGQLAVLGIGAGVVAITNLVVAKALLETKAAVESAGRSVGRTESALLRLGRVVNRDTERLGSRTGRLETTATAVERQIEVLGAEIPPIKEQLKMAGTQSAELGRGIGEIRKALTTLDEAHGITRTGLVTTRSITDKLAERVSGKMVDEERIRAAAIPRVASPLLSLAIPSFNRPKELAELLGSIATEVAACPDELIEVWITDDASPDPETQEIALEFVEAHPYASLRLQAANVGLERNVMAAAEPCRGEYIMVVGNDDLLEKGALRTILDDIEGTDAAVLLYGKSRINSDGSPRANVAGSIPIELPPGDTHLFATLVEASREQGLLSTFGFAGPIVVRRKPFLAVDPAPYLGLTLYARTGVLIEAFADSPVFYRNTATIAHRTPTPAQKHAEALGRQEEEFMSGGRTRLSRYFGTTLAATLQRLVDRGAIDHQTLNDMPERLMSDKSLVDWIAGNRAIDPTLDAKLGPEVVDDADRFFAALNGGPS